jgi:hypothetical protein
MKAINKYIAENVFCRCGQVVSTLVAAGLMQRPEMATSESEIYEWWLVSPDLADKLRARRAPVVQFCELNMWGRTRTGVPLTEDQTLLASIGSLEASAKH